MFFPVLKLKTKRFLELKEAVNGVAAWQGECVKRAGKS